MSRSILTKKMTGLVEEFHRSSQDQKSFAQSAGISKGKLQYWIKKLSVVSANRLPPTGVANFMPLSVTAIEESQNNMIRIRTSGGIEIEIPI